MRTNYNRHLEKNPRQNFFFRFPDTTSKILYKKIAFALVITSPRGEKKKKKKKTHLRLWNRNGGDDDVESDILQYLCATRRLVIVP